MLVTALDIGGANIKWASGRIDGQQRSRQVTQAASLPLAVWRHPDTLAARLAELLQGQVGTEALAVTMTAELCDCFATRGEGVSRVLDAVHTAAAGRSVRIWTTTGQLVGLAQARRQPAAVAAANWHALASWIARIYPDGEALLVDIGSTTTDIIPLADGQPRASGLNDTDRLASGELVYVGCRRTPLMALLSELLLGDRPHGVMAESFATSEDAYLLLGQLAEDERCGDTADGRPRTRQHAAARMLRMVGGDLDSHGHDEAVWLARQFAEELRRRIDRAAAAFASRLKRPPRRLVISGEGAFIAEPLLARRWPDAQRVRLADVLGAAASTAACAAALVHLWDAS